MTTNAWSGLNLKNQEIWESLWEKHVPAWGKAPTVGGEILRAMGRILYRFYNDGDMAGIDYGNQTCNPPDRYLSDTVPDYCALDGSPENSYEKRMLYNHRLVFEYLQSNPAVFTQENDIDSVEPCEEDYRRENDAEDWWDDEY